VKEFALKLYDLGFNVVPVVATVGGFENPWKPAAALVALELPSPAYTVPSASRGTGGASVHREQAGKEMP
jgi:hypothetical protein